MAELRAIQVLRNYLYSIEKHAQPEGEDEYWDLLSQGEGIDVLCARDEVLDEQLSDEERLELERLDDLLIKHRQLITSYVPPLPGKSRARWWWFLHEGPQVREQTKPRLRKAS